MKKIDNNKGFTLIEVILGIIIISIIFTGFSRFMFTVIKARYISDNKNRISNWAQTIMEYLKTQKLESGEYNPSDFSRLKELKEEKMKLNIIIEREVITIEKFESYSNLYQVNVDIKWGKGKKRRNLYVINFFISKK